MIGVVSTLAGSGLNSYADGVGSAASFKSPAGVAVTSSGVVFVADSDNQRIRVITTSGLLYFGIQSKLLFLVSSHHPLYVHCRISQYFSGIW